MNEKLRFNLDRSKLVSCLVAIDKVKGEVLPKKTISRFCSRNNLYINKHYSQTYIARVQSDYVRECVIPRAHKALRESGENLTAGEMTQRAGIPKEYTIMVARWVSRLDDIVITGRWKSRPQKYRWDPEASEH